MPRIQWHQPTLSFEGTRILSSSHPLPPLLLSRHPFFPLYFPLSFPLPLLPPLSFLILTRIGGVTRKKLKLHMHADASERIYWPEKFNSQLLKINLVPRVG